MEIGWDGILQEDTRGIFDMELEDIIKFADEDENTHSMVCFLLIYLKFLLWFNDEVFDN